MLKVGLVNEQVVCRNSLYFFFLLNFGRGEEGERRGRERKKGGERGGMREQRFSSLSGAAGVELLKHLRF